MPLVPPGGLERGIVTSTLDPTGTGRIQINLPAVLGAPTVWAEVMRPLSAAAAALNVADGDEVLVAFFQCDSDQPVVLGFIGPPNR